MCEWMLYPNADGSSMTLTTGHHRAMNILYPRGYKEIGVIVIYELAD